MISKALTEAKNAARGTPRKDTKLIVKSEEPIKMCEWFSEGVCESGYCLDCMSPVMRHHFLNIENKNVNVTENDEDDDENDEDDDCHSIPHCESCDFPQWRTQEEKHAVLIGKEYTGVRCSEEDDNGPYEFTDDEAESLARMLCNPKCKIRHVFICSSILTKKGINAIKDAVDKISRGEIEGVSARTIKTIIKV